MIDLNDLYLCPECNEAINQNDEVCPYCGVCIPIFILESILN